MAAMASQTESAAPAPPPTRVPAPQVVCSTSLSYCVLFLASLVVYLFFIPIVIVCAGWKCLC